MLVNQNLSLSRILQTTWKTDILIIVTCVIVFVIQQKVVPHAIQIPATLATLLGTAIAFFVGFNNNQAYDRWWEARTIWGALVNDCRSWSRQVLQYTSKRTNDDADMPMIRKRLVFRQIAFVYTLKGNLRNSADEYFKKYLTVEELEAVSREVNIPNAILSLSANDIEELSRKRAIDPFRFFQLNQLITAFTDHMGQSERIKNTVFPTSYIYFTRLFIWVLVVFTTLILAANIGGWSILIGWIVGFVFHAAHLNGMGLVNPFVETPTGVPLNQIARTIEINLLQMLGEEDIPLPVLPVNGEYIL